MIKEAAAFLGVSPNTLRNWERGGKITTHRHPLNSYRLYKRTDLESLLTAIAQSTHGTQPTQRPKQ
jgi:DNA-binding transcriptional MerR regulator